MGDKDKLFKFLTPSLPTYFKVELHRLTNESALHLFILRVRAFFMCLLHFSYFPSFLKLQKNLCLPNTICSARLYARQDCKAERGGFHKPYGLYS